MTTAHRVPVLPEPIDATIRPPGSKSETVRALAVAAMADGRSHLYDPLDADDPSWDLWDPMLARERDPEDEDRT